MYSFSYFNFIYIYFFRIILVTIKCVWCKFSNLETFKLTLALSNQYMGFFRCKYIYIYIFTYSSCIAQGCVYCLCSVVINIHFIITRLFDMAKYPLSEPHRKQTAGKYTHSMCAIDKSFNNNTLVMSPKYDAVESSSVNRV